jgi:hypothetical protein
MIHEQELDSKIIHNPFLVFFPICLWKKLYTFFRILKIFHATLQIYFTKCNTKMVFNIVSEHITIVSKFSSIIVF